MLTLRPTFQKLPVTVIVVLASIVLNGLFGTLNEALALPIFMDSIFTVVVAGLFGLVPGLIVGCLSNFVFEFLKHFPGYIYPFAVVNMATALTTWLFFRKTTNVKPIQVAALIVALSLVNAFLGALIITFVFGGITNQPVDSIVRSIIITGQSVPTSAFVGRILVNFVDKGIAVLVLLLFIRLITIKPTTHEEV